MDIDINTVRSIATVICFVMFVGIVAWAWHQRRTGALDEAARLPFAED